MVEAWRLAAESEVVLCCWMSHWTGRLIGEVERSDEWHGDAVVVEWVEGWRTAMTNCCWRMSCCCCWTKRKRKRMVMTGARLEVSLLLAVVRVLAD